MLTVFHAGDQRDRTNRLLQGRFDASDEEALDVHTTPGVWCSSTFYPWAGLRDGQRIVIRHILGLELDCNEAEIEQYADVEHGVLSGSFWLAHEFVNERLCNATEVDPALFAGESFWASWQDWYDRRQASLAATED